MIQLQRVVLICYPHSHGQYLRGFTCASLAWFQKDPAIAEAVATLKGEGPPSLCLVSNLRRAISTAVVGLAPRFDKGTQKLHVISELQEISRNPDALSITGAKEVGSGFAESP